MRSGERRSLKFQGDTREDRQASERAAAAAARPHQYENEPAVTATAVRLP